MSWFVSKPRQTTMIFVHQSATYITNYNCLRTSVFTCRPISCQYLGPLYCKWNSRADVTLSYLLTHNNVHIYHSKYTQNCWQQLKGWFRPRSVITTGPLESQPDFGPNKSKYALHSRAKTVHSVNKNVSASEWLCAPDPLLGFTPDRPHWRPADFTPFQQF